MFSGRGYGSTILFRDLLTFSNLGQEGKFRQIEVGGPCSLLATQAPRSVTLFCFHCCCYYCQTALACPVPSVLQQCYTMVAAPSALLAPRAQRRLAAVLVPWPRFVVLTPKSSQKPVEAASSSHSPLSSPPSSLSLCN